MEKGRHDLRANRVTLRERLRRGGFPATYFLRLFLGEQLCAAARDLAFHPLTTLVVRELYRESRINIVDQLPICDSNEANHSSCQRQNL
jgi:hypothetical protein